MNQGVWKTGITDTRDGVIRIQGYEITDLMRNADFIQVIFLLHQGRLPTNGEKRLLNTLLVACADHGPQAPSIAAARVVASGNRHSYEAAVAAGVLAIGDAHGGAGQACMEMIAAGLALAKSQGISLEDAAAEILKQYVSNKQRIPGIGHRIHKADPRVEMIFQIALEEQIAGDGIQLLIAIKNVAKIQIRDLPINVDGALAASLHDLGFSSELGKAIFILSRTAGITAHVSEELRREPPMRFRPPVEYDGADLRNC
jgi:citrate synthase